MSSQYETTAGTAPAPYAEHEPRTIERHITVDQFHDETDLHMMTEIGDGVFVAWSNCRSCKKRVYDCKCSGGPTEPHYMKKWRDDRFVKDLNTRPDPDFPLLPSVLEWARERGYIVAKQDEVDELFIKLFKAVAACEAPEGTQVDDVLGDFQSAFNELTGYVPPSVEDDPESPDEPDNLTGMDLGDGTTIDEDDLSFARETLGKEATDDEVTELAHERATRNLEERNLDAGF